MPDTSILKWDKAAASLDLFSRGDNIRYENFKRTLFSKCRGKVLLIAAGTGADFDCFPEGLDITAVDFSWKMLEKAHEKTARYPGNIRLVRTDAEHLGLKADVFDTVVTSCTFCSVPEPVAGLKELFRVMKADGRLLMFEHVGSKNPVIGAMMALMNPVVKFLGPELTRDTAQNVRKAGFTITRECNLYLDMLKIFEAKKGALL